jgi:hypothetical protein
MELSLKMIFSSCFVHYPSMKSEKDTYKMKKASVRFKIRNISRILDGVQTGNVMSCMKLSAARSYIGHLSTLSTILATWEPVEGEFLSWNFTRPTNLARQP